MVDSTDRERLTITKEELWRMLAHEVKLSTIFYLNGYCLSFLKKTYELVIKIYVLVIANTKEFLTSYVLHVKI